jgi:hypothetical protein
MVDYNAVNVKVPEGIVEILDGTFWGMPNLVSVYLPSTLRIIHQEAFCKCEKLKYINFPPGLVSI